MLPLSQRRVTIYRALKAAKGRLSPGGFVHPDTDRLLLLLLLLKGRKAADKRDYLFVAIDDFYTLPFCRTKPQTVLPSF